MTTSVVVTVVNSIVNLLATISPPTYKFPPIPTPPTTLSAPVVLETAAVVLVIVVAGTVSVRLLVL